MEIAVPESTAALTLGPVLFDWNAERWRDFYFRIADEAPVETVYVGEVVCSKRAPFFEPHYETVIGRLTAAGKKVVLSTLAEVMIPHDRKIVESLCASEDILVEANDGSALHYLRGRPHHVGPFMNVYNEATVAVLARDGARHFCLPPELPASAVRALCKHSRDLGVSFETQVFGRVSLALSARCYHARAHGRTKDSCQFVCEEDPDGLELRTLDGKPFLTVNGIQTMSRAYLNLVNELDELRTMGVAHFRLSPHTCDMVEVAAIFRAVLDRRLAPDEASARLATLLPDTTFSNGFYYRKPGRNWIAGARSD